MSITLFFVLSAILSAFVLVGLSMQSKVRSAVAGNLVCTGVMALAIVLTVWNALTVFRLWILLAALGAMAIGLIIGLVWAKKVKMIEMPQTVALLNGIGGLASAFVGAIELVKTDSSVFANVTAALALVIGAITFTGSLIAALKLARKIDSRPKKFKGHSLVSVLLLVACLVGVVLAAFNGLQIVSLVICAVAALLFGWLFAMRVGGADMPVAISLLNSLSGVAGAIAGMAISNVLLVAVGGIVGSSGLLLTQIMCRAMNRHLLDILLGKTVKIDKPGEKKEETPAPEPEPEPEPEAPFSLKDAKNVIIVPGYGMALS
ncbi:MAG: NAD(P)(+) transhydrogenase (Re/Si-specific) subunit beta, partial [Clostridia bacterium]|nr:NAD(P)(+) transhydrogenase (Re/Si-specific) subunit beta [Clostridia bacterium]